MANKGPQDKAEEEPLLDLNGKSTGKSKPSNNHDSDQNVAETQIGAEDTNISGTGQYQFGTFTYSDQEGTIDEREHKFVKVTNTNEEPLDVRDLVQKIKEEWKLKRPNLVISVTGGAWDFPMNSHVREVFRKGIVEAADSTDAVVITGGTNVGVMKYTGEAMKNYKTATGKGKKVVTLGIATWAKLRKDIKEKLCDAIDKKEEATLQIQCPEGMKANGTLEPNHSHYILVDDGKGKWGADIPVRAELEKQIKTMHVKKMGINVEIQDSQINCSNRDHTTCNHTNGRLNSASGWTPDSTEENPWIEVNLGGTKIVSEVVTQGNRKENMWVTKYKIGYKEKDEEELKYIMDESTHKPKVFVGNEDRKTEKKNILPVPIRASVIRIEPIKDKPISLRFELRGFEESNLEYTQIKCSSTGSDKKHARCNHNKCRLDDVSAWTPDRSDRNQWLEIDLGTTKLVSRIVTKGHPTDEKWVTKYKIQYKVGEKDEWKHVKDKSSKKHKIFSGYCEKDGSDGKMDNPLKEPIRATVIRFVPYEWSPNGIGMQFGLQGSDKLQVDNLGMKIEKIQDNQISCSSAGADYKHSTCNHSRGRLNGFSSWSPEKQWIQVDFGNDQEVSEVVTQGNPIADQWVTKYKVQYKKNNEDWKYAKNEDGEMIFAGNEDRNTERRNTIPAITASSIRLVANAWHNGISMRFDLKGPNGSVMNTQGINTKCSVEGSNEESNDQNHHEELYCNHTGYHLNDQSAWTPETQWIQVDFGTPKDISEVVTKGNPNADHWVTKYKVQYKIEEGDEWKYVKGESTDMVFGGNSDNSTEVSNQLPAVLKASVIRLVPVDWNNGISMRFDVKGPDGSLMESTQVKITCSGEGADKAHEYCNHESFHLNDNCAWTPEVQWIEVDLGVTKLISEVVTQGKPNADKWVTKYKMQYKVGDGDEWNYVIDESEEKAMIFTGNYDSIGERSNPFPAPVRASFIRLVPIDWKNGISMRFELKGSDDLPVVCILVEGGPNSIQQACEAVEKGTPVVVVGNSGRASDVLAYAFQKGKQLARDNLKSRLNKILPTGKIDTSIKQIEGALERSSMLNIHDAKSSTEIDQMILLALMKANKTNIGLQMTLAQTWNRIDIVKDEIFESLGNTLDWDRYQREEDTNYDNLHKALINDQAGFVKIYVDNMVVDLKRFLTVEALRQLYLETCQIWMEDGFSEDEMDTDILVQVGQRLADLTSLDFEDYQSSDGSALNKELRPSDDPLRHLFIFAILNDFVEMAEYFWEEGQEYIASALVASKIYKSRAEQASSIKKEKKDCFLQIEKRYDELACEVLNECEEHSEDNDSPDILLRQLNNWGGKTCLDLAEISDNKSFIANSAVQALLEDVWCHGKGFVDKEIIPSEFSRSSRKRFLNVLFSSFRMKNGLYSPQSKFWLSGIFYLLFLALFTYVMVSDQLSKRWPEGWEGLLILWGITFITEEIRQLLAPTLSEMKDSVKLYFEDRWNWVDICMLGTFVIGFGLRLAGESGRGGGATIVLAASVFCFYFRLLHKLTKFKHTGPKVLMIGHMLVDLIVFMGIILIILIGYGVAVKAVLYPHHTDPITVFREILYRPYFQIYGELFLEDIHATEEDDCSSNEADVKMGDIPCAENSSWGVVFLAIYLVFSNVLLLNLLIAMFSHTFDKVEEENDIHWKFLRYSLTKEYCNRPLLPPPLIILSHVSRMTRCCLEWCMKKAGKKDIPDRVTWRANVMVRNLSEDDTARIIKMEQRCAYGNILYKRRQEREEKSLQTQLAELECSFTSLNCRFDDLKRSLLNEKTPDIKERL